MCDFHSLVINPVNSSTNQKDQKGWTSEAIESNQGPEVGMSPYFDEYCVLVLLLSHRCRMFLLPQCCAGRLALALGATQLLLLPPLLLTRSTNPRISGLTSCGASSCIYGAQNDRAAGMNEFTTL